MKRTPQRSLLLFWLTALAWGGGVAALAWTAPAQPVLLLAAWVAGAALLLLLALYLGLSFRLDLLQVQQTLREASRGEPDAEGQGKRVLAALWWPLIDAVARQDPPRDPAASDQRHQAEMQEQMQAQTQLQAQLDALHSALAAERAQVGAWQQRAARAQAEQDVLRQQVQDAATALESVDSLLAAVTPVHDIPPAATNDAQRTAAEVLSADLSARLSALTVECEACARAEAQHEEASRAQALTHAAQQAQVDAAQRQHARQLTQAVDALQLLGLNLRLQLSHLANAPGTGTATFAQTEADLDALLGGVKQLSADWPACNAPEHTANAPEPQPDQQARAQLLEHLLEHLRRAMAELAAAQGYDAAQDAAQTEAQRLQWQAAAQQQARQIASIRQQFQTLRHTLLRAAKKNSSSL